MQMIHTTAEAEKKALAFKNIFNREKETGIYNFHNELPDQLCCKNNSFSKFLNIKLTKTLQRYPIYLILNFQILLFISYC